MKRKYTYTIRLIFIYAKRKNLLQQEIILMKSFFITNVNDTLVVGTFSFLV